MNEIFAATPPPGSSDPRNNGHAPVLVGDWLVDDRTPYEAWSDAVIDDPAWYSADTIAHQDSILDLELDAFLRDETLSPVAETPHTENALLPGFETLTWADLDRAARDGVPAGDCMVGWCVHQGLPVHSDGFDADPEQAPHRSVEHTIRAVHGGESLDHAGRAEVTVQLEQDRDLESGPTVNLAVVVRGIEQYTWLTIPETRALRHALSHLLTEASTETSTEAANGPDNGR